MSRTIASQEINSNKSGLESILEDALNDGIINNVTLENKRKKLFRRASTYQPGPPESIFNDANLVTDNNINLQPKNPQELNKFGCSLEAPPFIFNEDDNCNNLANSFYTSTPIRKPVARNHKTFIITPSESPSKGNSDEHNSTVNTTKRSLNVLKNGENVSKKSLNKRRCSRSFLSLENKSRVTSPDKSSRSPRRSERISRYTKGCSKSFQESVQSCKTRSRNTAEISINGSQLQMSAQSKHKQATPDQIQQNEILSNADEYKNHTETKEINTPVTNKNRKRSSVSNISTRSRKRLKKGGSSINFDGTEADKSKNQTNKTTELNTPKTRSANSPVQLRMCLRSSSRKQNSQVEIDTLKKVTPAKKNSFKVHLDDEKVLNSDKKSEKTVKTARQEVQSNKNNRTPVTNLNEISAAESSHFSKTSIHVEEENVAIAADVIKVTSVEESLYKSSEKCISPRKSLRNTSKGELITDCNKVSSVKKPHRKSPKKQTSAVEAGPSVSSSTSHSNPKEDVSVEDVSVAEKNSMQVTQTDTENIIPPVQVKSTAKMLKKNKRVIDLEEANCGVRRSERTRKPVKYPCTGVVFSTNTRFVRECNKNNFYNYRNIDDENVCKMLSPYLRKFKRKVPPKRIGLNNSVLQGIEEILSRKDSRRSRNSGGHRASKIDSSNSIVMRKSNSKSTESVRTSARNSETKSSNNSRSRKKTLPVLQKILETRKI